MSKTSKVRNFTQQNMIFEQYSELCEKIRLTLLDEQLIISTNLLQFFIRLFGDLECADCIFDLFVNNIDNQQIISSETFINQIDTINYYYQEGKYESEEKTCLKLFLIQVIH